MYNDDSDRVNLNCDGPTPDPVVPEFAYGFKGQPGLPEALKGTRLLICPKHRMVIAVQPLAESVRDAPCAMCTEGRIEMTGLRDEDYLYLDIAPSWSIESLQAEYGCTVAEAREHIAIHMLQGRES